MSLHPHHTETTSTIDLLSAINELAENTKASVQSRRGNNRFELNCSVRVAPANSSDRDKFLLEGRCRDVSPTGGRLILDQAMMVGDVYLVHIEGENFKLDPVFVRCIRCHLIRENNFECGISFLSPVDLEPAFGKGGSTSTFSNTPSGSQTLPSTVPPAAPPVVPQQMAPAAPQPTAPAMPVTTQQANTAPAQSAPVAPVVPQIDIRIPQATTAIPEVTPVAVPQTNTISPQNTPAMPVVPQIEIRVPQATTPLPEVTPVVAPQNAPPAIRETTETVQTDVTPTVAPRMEMPTQPVQIQVQPNG